MTCIRQHALTLVFFSSNNQINKHTESIAKAIQVPHRPQQIEICNHYFGTLFNKEQLELLRP